MKSLNGKLFAAIMQKDHVQVKNLLDSGASVYAINDKGESVLHACMSEYSYLMFKILTSAGADVNSIGPLGHTVLHYAIMHHQIGAIKPLIDAGVNIDEANILKKTAAHLAIEAKLVGANTILSSMGANINCVDTMGLTPLILAMESNVDALKEEMTKLLPNEKQKKTLGTNLCRSGKSLNIVHRVHCTFSKLNPIENPAPTNIQEARAVIEQFSETQIGIMMKLLAFSSVHNFRKSVSDFIDYNIPVMYEEDGPLVAAVECADLNTIKIFFNKIPDLLKTTTKAGQINIVNAAFHSGNIEVFDFLIDEIGMSMDFTSAELAASSGQVHMLKNFRKRQNELDIKKLIPICAKEGHTNAVDYLLNLDEPEDLQSHSNALSLAIVNGHAKIVELLIEKPIHFNFSSHFKENVLTMACQLNSTKTLEVILRALTSKDFSKDLSSEALLFAASKGNLQACRLLLEFYADPNAVNEHGQNCFDCSIESNHPELAGFLFKWGVRPNINDGDALQNLCDKSLKKGDFELSSILMSMGAKPKLSDYSNDIKTIDFLLDNWEETFEFKAVSPIAQ